MLELLLLEISSVVAFLHSYLQETMRIFHVLKISFKKCYRMQCCINLATVSDAENPILLKYNEMVIRNALHQHILAVALKKSTLPSC